MRKYIKLPNGATIDSENDKEIEKAISDFLGWEFAEWYTFMITELEKANTALVELNEISSDAIKRLENAKRINREKVYKDLVKINEVINNYI